DRGRHHRYSGDGGVAGVSHLRAAPAGKILMTWNGWLQIGVYCATVLAVTVPLGRFIARVFRGERTWLDPVCRPIERAIYRATGVDERHEMRWTEYATAVLLF